MAEIPEEFWHNDEAVRAFQAGREAAAADIEASARIAPENRYRGCTCRAGVECHPHACHRAMNEVTRAADEETWPVHIASRVWDRLDPLIRADAAKIARGDRDAR